ncbi:MAG: MoaD/ThiS family protein [Nitrososphaeraceae archaeon]|jgi:molybdopterin converting factor subunit 1
MTTTTDDRETDLIKVKLFGISTEIVGKSEMTLLVPVGTTVGNLKKKITKMYPSLDVANVPYVFAVNHRVASEDVPVTHLDEIAILPPVSGG